MKNLINANIKHILRRPELYLSPIIIAGLLWLSIYDDYRVSNSDVVYYYGLAKLSIFSKLSLALSATITAVDFCNDWNSRFFWSNCIRCGVRKYSLGKCLLSIFSGGLVAIVGEIIFILTLCVTRPIFDFSVENPSIAIPALKSLLDNQQYLSYFAICLISLFLRNSLFALIALYVSTFITNRFVTIVSPIIVWFALSFVGSILGLTPLLRADVIFEGYYDMGNAFIWLLYLVCFTVFCEIGITMLCKKSLSRRIEKW